MQAHASCTNGQKMTSVALSLRAGWPPAQPSGGKLGSFPCVPKKAWGLTTLYRDSQMGLQAMALVSFPLQLPIRYADPLYA